MQEEKIQNINTKFVILDLFSGAGGMSYGMHKNPHFKTAVALDMNAEAVNTFKMNMPGTEVLIGDITRKEIKEKIIELSKENNAFDINRRDRILNAIIE